MNQYAQSQDPFVKDTTQLGSYFKQQIPSLRSHVRDMYDPYGAPMLVNAYRGINAKTVSAGYSGPHAEYAKNPYNPEDRLTRKFHELGMEFKQVPREIRTPSPVPGVPGVKVALADDEYAEIQRWRNKGYSTSVNGQEVAALPSFRQYMEVWTGNPGFDKLHPELQKGLLQDRKEKYSEMTNKLALTLPSFKARYLEAAHKQVNKLKFLDANEEVTQ